MIPVDPGGPVEVEPVGEADTLAPAELADAAAEKDLGDSVSVNDGVVRVDWIDAAGTYHVAQYQPTKDGTVLEALQVLKSRAPKMPGVDVAIAEEIAAKVSESPIVDELKEEEIK